MKIKLLILYAILLSHPLIGCNFTMKDKVKRLYSKDIDITGLSLNTILFINEDTGFIAGRYGSMNNKISDKGKFTFTTLKSSAWLFKTTDGGKTWVKRELGDGAINNIFFLNDRLFLFKKENDTTESIICYFSDDTGNTWERIGKFPNGIYDMIASSKHTLMAIGEDSKTANSVVYESKDNGVLWDVLMKLPCAIFGHGIEYQGRVYFLCNENGKVNYYAHSLIVYDVNMAKYSFITFPKEFNACEIANSHGKIRICGIENDNITI